MQILSAGLILMDTITIFDCDEWLRLVTSYIKLFQLGFSFNKVEKDQAAC